MPVKIRGVHKPGKGLIVVVVKNFPLIRAGKILWWKEHQLELKQQYPSIFSPGIHYVLFLKNDYKKDSGTDEDSDLLCFQEMNTEKNCISKENRPLLVWHDADGHTEYETENIFQRFFRHF